MSSVSDCVGNAGGGSFAVVWRGETYPILFPCPATIARLEKLVLRRQMDGLAESKDALTPAEFAAQTEALRLDVRAREWRAGGAMWNRELTAQGGRLMLPLMLWSCLPEKRADGELFTVADVQRMWADAPEEVEPIAEAILPDFTRRVGEAQNHPPATVEAMVKATADEIKKARR